MIFKSDDQTVTQPRVEARTDAWRRCLPVLV